MLLINDNLINMNLVAKNKIDVIEQLAELLIKDGRITNAGEFMKDVIEREQMSTTGFGEGVAIPHARSDSVQHTSLVFARLNQPLDWESLDGEQVNVVIMIAVPKSDKDNTHLKMISQLATNLINPEFSTKLRSIECIHELKNHILESMKEGA